MRLAKFILNNMPEILAEWDAFASTIDTTTEMSAKALRDHAKPILEAIAADMAISESPEEQLDKSRGLLPVDIASAASTHGTLRHVSGFTLIQLTAEYRALRASVLRLWLPQVKTFDAGMASDMVRFNETIDEALAESVLTFSAQGLRTRDTFLAVLGHDLRSPLAGMLYAGEVLVRQQPSPEDLREIGMRVRRSAAAMTAMVNDLLEFARIQIGGLMPINPVALDLLPVCSDAVEDARAAHPDCHFELETDGDLNCNADALRIQQLLSNLLNNAAQYSSKDLPVRLAARGGSGAVMITVANFGSLIPPEAIGSIFQPLVQLEPDDGDRGRPNTSIGLGLFIAREITLAHGGSIDVTSSRGEGTVFTVRLPKLLSGQELGRIQAQQA